MRITLPAAMIGFAMLAACGDGAPAPKPPAPFAVSKAVPAADAGGASGDVAGDPATAVCGGFTFPKPAAWKGVKPTAAFRTLQFEVPGTGGAADLIFSVFTDGQGGKPEENIQRWRNQFRDANGQPAAPTETRRKVGDLMVQRVDIRGAWKGMGMQAAREGTVQLAAIVPAEAGTMIYVRLVGAETTVEAVRANFERMIDGMHR